MRTLPLSAAVIAVAVLTGCVSPSPALPPAGSTSATVGSVSSPPPSPSPDASLPEGFPVRGSLIDDVPRVVEELQRVAGGLPAIKLDISTEQVTLNVVAPDHTVRSYRWRDGTISSVDSDVQYLQQATFNPESYPLATIQRILDVAAMMAGSSENQVLQVVEYRDGAVFMSVTTRPESKTVFFKRDGTAITDVGVRSVEDITTGLAAVAGSANFVTAVGFSKDQGYWADVKLPRGVVERRTRMGAVPVFASRRNQATDLRSFRPELLDPAALAQAIATRVATPDGNCSVEIDDRFKRSQPVVRYDCDGRVSYSDLHGRDMTSQLG